MPEHARPENGRLPGRSGITLGREAFEGYKDLYSGGVRMVDDLILHDMLHLELARAGKQWRDGSDDWDAAVEELSPEVLGRKLRMPADAMRPSSRTYLPPEVKMTGWPYDFRPGNYTWGRKIACPSWCG